MHAVAVLTCGDTRKDAHSMNREQMIEALLESTMQQADLIRDLTQSPDVRVAAMNIQTNVILLRRALEAK